MTIDLTGRAPWSVSKFVGCGVVVRFESICRIKKGDENCIWDENCMEKESFVEQNDLLTVHRREAPQRFILPAHNAIVESPQEQRMPTPMEKSRTSSVLNGS